MRQKLRWLAGIAAAALAATLGVVMNGGGPELPYWFPPLLVAGLVITAAWWLLCSDGLSRKQVITVSLADLILSISAFLATELVIRPQWSPLTIDYRRLTEVENEPKDGELRMVLALDTATATPDSLMPDGMVSMVEPHIVRQCSIHMPPSEYSSTVTNTTGLSLRDLRMLYDATFFIAGDSIPVGSRHVSVRIPYLPADSAYCFYLTNRTNLDVTLVPGRATARAWSGKDPRVRELEITSNHIDQFAEPPLHLGPR